ncbi:hypothetical protein Goklo_002217 [Gossypium klotzschianum]|uniref:Uncharacterized protein n=1 Tax=Gossypium klotzschianum TaxID=34286 RepID=A0A7J8VSE1_9ROSI|nr:hypothetical protein [Gossypium klotzschianum]
MAAPQNPSPFLASGSLEFGGEGSFSLGTNGVDKSARKYVKVLKQRKKLEELLIVAVCCSHQNVIDAGTNVRSC